MASDDKWPHETPEVLALGSTFSPQVLVLASCVFAVLLVIVFAFVKKSSSSSKRDALLLVGPAGSGKTAIMSKLVYDRILPTQSSMQTNISSFAVSPKKTLRLIDVPGHPRLRGQFQEHIPASKAVLFTVDTSTISRDAADVAEHLHYILHALTSLPPSQTQPSLVIIANKYDLLRPSSSSTTTTTTTTSSQNSPASLAINRVKTLLERELEKRRQSHAGGVHIEGLGEEGEETSELGGLVCGEKGDGAFKFDQWEGGAVTFVATSPLLDGSSEKMPEDGMASLREWLEEGL